MKHFFRNYLIYNILFCLLPLTVLSKSTSSDRLTNKVKSQMQSWENPIKGWSHVGKIKIDSISVLQENKTLQFFFTDPLSYIPVREENSRLLVESLKVQAGRKFRSWSYEVYTDHHALQDLIPNALRNTVPQDAARIPLNRKQQRIPLVKRLSAETPLHGLYNNNLAIWPSHGWYYESKLDRWEWQRARLFGTVEDIFTKKVTMQYLVPMLENSGAVVLLPEERDWQPREVIVDFDRSSGGSKMVFPDKTAFYADKPGFLLKDTLFSGDNPFEAGHCLTFNAEPGDRKVIAYPQLEPGEYAVYISYKSYEKSSQEVKVTVTNAQGDHEFMVNQRIGGGTWVYLGTFPFICKDDGKSPEAEVAVSLKGKPGEVISIDAIKLGGGMGNIARRPSVVAMQNVRSVNDAQEKAAETKLRPELFTWKTSGKSRYREGARYYLQYAGFPDSLVYNLNQDKNDYNDDYQSRGEWVNYLTGNPNGPQKDRKVRGLQIPVDLAFAFHTDAGITPNDSIIGTLGIYSTMSDKGMFPEGSSRMASRDLADLIQSQITEDIRTLFNPEWTRRGLWDKQYSEAWRPNVPVMLLELLSHQNLADMRFGLDPRFQFAVGRAIYKGMLKFQAKQENRHFVVQPLPVDHFALQLIGDTAVRLTWNPVLDPLEPAAIPDKYRVYCQTGRNGFDEGVSVTDTSLIVSLKAKNTDFSFKVTALNSGGESFPSETLSAGLTPNSKGTVLVVNGFDRICGPAFIDTGSLAGVEEWQDQGVAWHYNQGYTGQQYDFARHNAWKDDDNPGWGSSYGDKENIRVAGNSFDYTIVHGEALRKAGYNYVSVSDEVFEKPGYNISGFTSFDIVMGKEKNTPALKKEAPDEFKIYTPAFRDKLKEVTRQGKNILLSGAYIGSDFTESADTISEKFARETLHFIHRTGHAVKNGPFYSTDYGNKWFHISGSFNTGDDVETYAVEAPDGIEPAGLGAITAFRYGENNVSAGTAYRGKYKCVALGFPLETITDHGVLKELMKQVMGFFEEEK
jgi:hypothetical protein